MDMKEIMLLLVGEVTEVAEEKAKAREKAREVKEETEVEVEVEEEEAGAMVEEGEECVM